MAFDLNDEELEATRRMHGLIKDKGENEDGNSIRQEKEQKSSKEN